MDEKRKKSEDLCKENVGTWEPLTAEELADQPEMELLGDISEEELLADSVHDILSARDIICDTAGSVRIPDAVVYRLMDTILSLNRIKARLMAANGLYDLGLIARYILAICMSVYSSSDVIPAITKLMREYDVISIFEGNGNTLYRAELVRLFSTYTSIPKVYADRVYAGMRKWPYVVNLCQTEPDINKLYNTLTSRVKGMSFRAAAEFLRNVGINTLDSDNIPMLNQHVTKFVQSVDIDIAKASTNYSHPRTVSKLFREWCRVHRIPTAIASFLVDIAYSEDSMYLDIGDFDDIGYEYTPYTVDKS